MKTPGKYLPRAVAEGFADKEVSDLQGLKPLKKRQTLCRA